TRSRSTYFSGKAVRFLESAKLFHLPTCDQIDVPLREDAMIARDLPNTKTLLLSLPPTPRQTRSVIAVAACQLAALVLFAPFAKTPLAAIDSFIPAFEGII